MNLNPAAGWDELLDRVCEREVRQIWGAGFQASELRLYIEGLATQARRAPVGKGLQQTDLQQVFRRVFGRDADEPAGLLTARLPGLGAVAGNSGAREFIDPDFADVASSGDMSRYVSLPYEAASPLEGLQQPLGDLAREICLWRLGDSFAKLSVALECASQQENVSTVSSDLMSMMLDSGTSYGGRDIEIRDLHFENLAIDSCIDLGRVTLSSCTISTLTISRSDATTESGRLPKLKDCMIGKLEGALSKHDVPSGILIGTTTVEDFSAYAATNVAVMNSPLPTSVKVLITILRKLFVQSGSGRKYGAFKRGIPQDAVRFVDPICSLIKSRGFAQDVSLNKTLVLIPNRTKSAEALGIINGPNTSENPLIRSVRAL